MYIGHILATVSNIQWESQNVSPADKAELLSFFLGGQGEGEYKISAFTSFFCAHYIWLVPFSLALFGSSKFCQDLIQQISVTNFIFCPS